MDIFSLDWNYIAVHYGPGAAIILYICWKDLYPAVKRYIPSIIRSQAKAQAQEAQLKAQAQAQEALLKAERESLEAELKERPVIALEMIGKEMAVSNQTLAVLKEQFSTYQRTQETLLTSHNAMMNTLNLLLERSERRREDFTRKKGGD